DGPLNISSIELIEDATDNRKEFSPGEDFPAGEVVLEPNGEFNFSVVWSPLNTLQDTGSLVINSNAREVEDRAKRITLTSADIGPELSSPQRISFARVAAGGSDNQLTFIINEGQSTLQIKDIRLNPDANKDFSLSYPTAGATDDPAQDSQTYQSTLEPGELMDVRVTFSPETNQPSSVDMIIFSNDPERSQYVVELTGNADTECISLGGVAEEGDTTTDTTHILPFGQSSISQATAKTVQLQNCSRTKELVIESIDLTDDGTDSVFSVKSGEVIDALATGDVVIPALESRNFVVEFQPNGEESSNGRVEIKNNDPVNSTLRVDLKGTGTTNQCPTAVAQGSIIGSGGAQRSQISTIPLKTVKFASNRSSDPDGEIDGYEWSIIQKPANSAARLSPANSVDAPELFLDIAGEYIIELTVIDALGARSCATSQVLIQATPDEDIHVQLVWDTPRDADQGDDRGSDVDLHYLHPLGQWDTEPYDIFWRNPTADWGIPGNQDDDPSLDIDDTDGQGPENVNHDKPGTGKTYAVGVHYYADNGLGPSYATLRIYVQGVLQYEVRDKFLEKEDIFWDVGAVVWPSKQIIAKDRIRNGFPGQ
ncbi:MAG: choice-of-anchor D domain-containing protein, partial [Myxococcota bacterium]